MNDKDSKSNLEEIREAARRARADAGLSPYPGVGEFSPGPHVSIREMQAQCHGLSRKMGWWDEQSRRKQIGFSAGDPDCNEYETDREGPLQRDLVELTIPEKLCLIHSEVSEALEDYRVRKMETTLDEKSKPVGLPTEVADIVIRCMDLAAALGIDLQEEIAKKHAFNQTRPFRHGGKRA